MKQNRKRKGQDSPFQSVLLIVLATVFLLAAVAVVVMIIGRMRDDYKSLGLKETEETQTEALEIEKLEEDGWNSTADGWKFRLQDGTYAADEWLVVEGFVYCFDEEGLMRTGEWTEEGQTYTFHAEKGYLKNIETDLNYVPKDNGENLESLARTNAFWCWLDEPTKESDSLFYDILYRKTVDNQTKPLGDEEEPERTTRYSLRADGDYIYWLPLVRDNQLSLLSQEDRDRCGVLWRMIPGQKKKEMIAEKVSGYLVLDGTVYYAQEGKIHAAETGTEVAVGEEAYTVELRGEEAYLVDALGSPLEGKTEAAVGDRLYKLSQTGRIEQVVHGSETIDGYSYRLNGSGTGSAVYRRGSAGDQRLIHEAYGVQSYCIVDNFIYYSAYVDKSENGAWYSQIFRTGLDGSGRTAVGGLFAGTIGNLYYFEKENAVYGDYYPTIWQNAYGTAVRVGLGGAIEQINDAAVRSGRSAGGNDCMAVADAAGGKVIALWQGCEWSAGSGITRLLWSEAVELQGSDVTPVETHKELLQETEEEQSESEEDVIIPISPKQEEELNETTAPTQPQTIAPAPTQSQTIAPSPTQSQTEAPAQTPEDSVRIIPLQ